MGHGLPDRPSSIWWTRLHAHAPEHAAIQVRLFDLEKEVVKPHVRHPDFQAFTSIKYVGPALVDDLSRGGLAIQNGDAAMLLYEAVAAGRDTLDEA